MGSEIDLNQQLKTKQICRFCLSIDVEFTDIFSNENRMNGRAPLPLQIMSCVSIEVRFVFQSKFHQHYLNLNKYN